MSEVGTLSFHPLHAPVVPRGPDKPKPATPNNLGQPRNMIPGTIESSYAHPDRSARRGPNIARGRSNGEFAPMAIPKSVNVSQ